MYNTSIKYYPYLGLLAEEIGNLRYDSVEEFLHFLAAKLTKDSEADAKNGRLQVANNLMSAARFLEKSSIEIRKAWRVCKPYLQDIFPEDIKDFLRNNFLVEEYFEAIKLLYDFEANIEADFNQGYNQSENTFRLSRCLLFLSQGSLPQLIEIIKRTNDYRELILEAEYDPHLNMLRNFNNEFGNEHKLETGFTNTDYVRHENDDLPF